MIKPKSGFKDCYFVMFAENHLFYIDKGCDGIYKMFRKEKLIRGQVIKPTGEKDKVLCIDKEYKIEWQTLIKRQALKKDDLKYFIIEVKV